MSAEGGTLTTTGYIQHHLTNMQVCGDAARDAAGHCHGFWTFHFDTLLVSGALGLLVFAGEPHHQVGAQAEIVIGASFSITGPAASRGVPSLGATCMRNPGAALHSQMPPPMSL